MTTSDPINGRRAFTDGITRDVYLYPRGSTSSVTTGAWSAACG